MIRVSIFVNLFDWLIRWFHELLFNESKNEFNEIFFVMIILEVQFLIGIKIYKKCRYDSLF